MARPNKQKQLLKKAREEKNSKKTFKITNVKRYVLALFYTGICYTNSSLLFLLNDIEAPGKTEFYEAQGEISNFLYQFANYSVNMAFENMKPNTIVSIDGSWSCRRNAKYFILDAIDTTTHKVIAYVLLHKATKELPGNYQGPSNMMEATAFKMLLPLLQSCDKIVGLVKDGDVKIDKIIRENGWNIPIYNDPNHRLKNFHTIFDRYNKMTDGKLRGLEARIKSWLNACMFSKKQTDDEKVVKYLNAFNHFTLDPKVANIHPNGKKWAHSNNITARTCLWNLLVETSDIIRTHHRGITTNKNENFHSIKARLLPKLYNWGSGWIGRICSAILQNNLPDIWMIYALSALNIPLPAIHTFLAYLHRVIQRKRDIQNKKLKEEKLKEEGKVYRKRKKPEAKTELSHI